MPDPIDPLLARLEPVSLEQLDERASLLRRVDHKHVVERDLFAHLVDELAGDHDVLEIGERRRFAYESTYFDTPDLRCFREHVDGVRPRFKARVRRYVDTSSCVFEVKLKDAHEETDKRQIDYDDEDKETITPAARRLIDEALHDAAVDPPGELGPTLTTAFDRVTLGAREGGARVTCDLGIRLVTPRGAAASMKPGCVLVETKSEDGSSRADRALRDAGVEPVSLSKYRTGIALLRADDPETDDVLDLFEKR
jgi:hypothetical protein